MKGAREPETLVAHIEAGAARETAAGQEVRSGNPRGQGKIRYDTAAGLTSAGRNRPSRDTFWPILLIAVGAALFAANFGWFGWGSLLDVARLWPVALVAVGVAILAGGRHRAWVVVGALAAAALLYAAGGIGFGPGGSSLDAVTVSQGLEGAARAEVRLSTGVAALRVNAAAGADLLASGTIRPGRGERIERSFRVAGGTARLDVRSERARTVFPGPTRGGAWDLTLTGRVPVTLEVDTGVGEATLDLRGLRLAGLDVDTGVGAATVILPRSGQYPVSIDTGVGNATISLPDGLAARVLVSRGVGAVSVPDGFLRDGDTYTSPGFETAAHRVELRVNGGVGAITIQRGG